jgi:SAM-dependent methyltransferase
VAHGDVEAEDWNKRYEGTELVWTIQPNRFLVEEVEGMKPGRALDLACGEGRHAVWLAGLFWEVLAVDWSDVAIAKGRELAERHAVAVDWVVADLRSYVPEPESADLVVIFYLQLVAEERSPILAKAAAAVAPGGTFLLVAHDLSNLERGYGGPKDPRVLYTAEDVVRDLAGSGLEIERAEPVERPVEGEGTAIDVLVRAGRPV